MAHILVVEDEPDIKELLRLMLKPYGCEVTFVENGFEALECVNDTKFDLILLDIKYPGKKNLPQLLQLKLNPETTEIPVVVMTVYAPEADQGQFVFAGCSGLLIKPFNAARLHFAIAEYLGDIIKFK